MTCDCLCAKTLAKNLGLLLCFLPVVLVAGCSGKPCEPQAAVTPAASSVLADADWALTLLEGRHLVPGTYISLRFEAATFGGSAGCNSYGGDYVAMDDGSLSNTEIAQTAMLCAEPEGVMEQEVAYVVALGRAAAYRLSEDILELQDAEGRTLLVFSPQPRSAMDPARLLGTTWRLISMDGEAPLPGSGITLAFLDEKWLAGNAGCRDYVSAYQAQSGDLSLLSTTMLEADCAAADRLRQEGDYTTLLEWVNGYRLSHGQLELLTDRGKSLLFEPLPVEAHATLEGPTWSLVAFVEEDNVESLQRPLPRATFVISGTEITLAFREDGAAGSAGCNTYQAAYDHDQTTIAFDPPSVTKMNCLTPAGVMVQEQRFLAFADYFTYQIAGRQLWLRAQDGQALVFTVSVPGVGPDTIPDDILSKANQIVVSRVGEAFFQDYWTFDPAGSRLDEPDPVCVQDPANCPPYASVPHYSIAYSFRLPGQSGVEAGVEVRLDLSGNLIEGDEMPDIPDCAHDPGQCVFIDEEAAMAAAREAGLESGVCEWATVFQWYDAEIDTFVWTVTSTLSDDPAGGSISREFIIDARSGSVLQVLELISLP